MGAQILASDLELSLQVTVLGRGGSYRHDCETSASLIGLSTRESG